MKPKTQASNGKIDKLNFINIKNFYASKNTIEKNEVTIFWMGEIFVNHI